MSKRSDAVLKARVSRKTYLFFYLMVIAIWGVIAYLYYAGSPPGRTAVIAAVVFTFFVIKSIEVYRWSILYEIKPLGLIHTRGIFSRKSKRVDYLAISDFDVSQTLWQRILGFGDVNIRIFSTDSMTSVKNINKPYKFLNILSETMDKKRREINVGEE